MIWRILRWSWNSTLAFVGALNALNGLTQQAVHDWFVNTYLSDFLLLLVGTPGLVILSGLTVVTLADQALQFRKWLRKFRLVARAESLSMASVLPQRRLEGKFVPLPRGLRIPPILGGARRVAEQKVSTDGAAFLRQLEQRPGWHDSRSGFLIEGPALCGKTRFVEQWLKAYHPKSIVLVPKFDTVPGSHYILRLLGHAFGIVIWLDDLDQYESKIRDMTTFISNLGSKAHPCLIVGTVRDGGPGLEIQRESFRALRERLDHYLLAPLTDDQTDVVAQELALPPPPPAQRTHTFDWLLNLDFVEMNRKYQVELAPKDRAILRAAKLLDHHGIPIARPRWEVVTTETMHRLEGASDFVDGLATLRRTGFMVGEFPEPAFLKNVVNGNVNLDELSPRLAQTLKELGDGEALWFWGTHLAMKGGPDAAPLLRDAAALCERNPTPRNDVICVLAHFNLGVALDQSNHLDEAVLAWNRALELGREARQPQAIEAGATAAFNLGVVTGQKGDLHAAIALWREAAALGVRSGLQEGLETATDATYNQAETEAEGRNLPEARRLWEEALGLGRRSSRARGRLTASRAAYQLGASGNELKLATDELVAWWKQAEELGLLCDLPEGFEVAAKAATDIGGVVADRDVEVARGAWNTAVSYGLRSCTPTGLEAAATASFNLALAFQKAGDQETASVMFEKALAHGFASSTTEALSIATKSLVARANMVLLQSDEAPLGLFERMLNGDTGTAAQRLAASSAASQWVAETTNLRGRFDVAARYWDKSIEYGRKSGLPEGLATASVSASNASSVLERLGRLDDSRSLWDVVVDLGIRSQLPHGLTAAALVLFNKGVLAQNEGHTADAERFWRQSVEIAREIASEQARITVARSAYNLGCILADRGDVEPALVLWRDATVFVSQHAIPDANEIAIQAYLRAGAEHQKRGSTEEAQTSWNAACVIARSDRRPSVLWPGAVAAANLGIVFESTNDFEPAVTALAEAVQFGEEAGSREGFDAAAQASFRLGGILAELGRGDEAVLSWNRAVQIGKRAETPEGLKVVVAAAYNVLAVDASLDGAIVENARSALDAADMLPSVQEKLLAAHVALEAGRRLSRDGRKDEARVFLVTAGRASSLGGPGGAELAAAAVAELSRLP